MKKIKILQTIRQGSIGGGETHVLELCTHLDKSKFETVVLSFTSGEMVEELERRGIRTKVIYTEKPFDIRLWGEVKKFMLAEKFDLIHAHGTRAISNVFWAAKQLKLPLIYTVHGWSFHTGQKFYVRKLRELSESFLTSKSDKVICVSKSNQDDGIELFNMKRSMVIYNAVNLEKFNFENNYKDIRKELGISPEIVLIGYIVRITAQKDPFTLLKAMKRVVEDSDNTILLLVGDGDLKQEAVQLSKELGIEKKVIFEPFRTDIPAILNAIDIYCLPSLWEGFPIGVIEAMAMKKAVVASAVNGTKELIEDGKTGLFIKEGKVEELADKLLLLNKNKNLRQLLGENATKVVKEKFGIKQLVTQVEAVYLELRRSI